MQTFYHQLVKVNLNLTLIIAVAWRPTVGFSRSLKIPRWGQLVFVLFSICKRLFYTFKTMALQSQGILL